MMARLYEDERAARLPFRFADKELVCWEPGQLHIPSVLTMLDYLSDVLDRVPEFVWEGRTDE